MRAKHIIGDFEGFLEGALDFFYPQIVLRAPKGNLEVNFGKRDRVNSLRPGGGGH
jgi:hypothetical protein